MGNQLNKTIKTLAQTIKKSSGEKTKSYDKSAEVVRVEGDTAWVHVPGGVEATPVKMTISAKKGDKVKVHFSKGSAWITGNLTSPPTDDASVTELEEDVVVIKDTIESADFGKGEDGEPGASVSKIVFEYCLSDSNQLDPEGDVDMITDDWLDYIPTIDDVPKDEDEYELDATEIEDVQTSGEYSMGEIVYQIVSVSVNGAAFTSYTVENKDDEGETCSFVIFDKSALPATVTSIAITFIAGLEPFYYIWQRTLTYRDDMDEEEDEPIEGTPQLYGTISSASSDIDFTIKTIIREETEYCLASSTAIPSGGTFEDIQVTQWSVGVPTYQAGNYFWSRIKYYYSDGTVSYTPPAYDFSAQVAHEVATAEASTDNHFWSDQSGAYVGHYEEDATRGAVLRAVGEGVLLYYDNKKKAAFTDSGVSFWDGTAGNETQLATYANGGISFNDNVPFSIGNNSSYIKWVKENNVWKIKIAADAIQMGGAGMKNIQSTQIAYATSTNGTNPPATFPYSTPPNVPEGRYLWSRNLITYTDGTTDTVYNVAKQGENGAQGPAGTDVSSVYLTEVTNDGLFVHRADGSYAGTTPTASNAYGVHINNNVNVIRSGSVVGKFGTTNQGDSQLTLGKTTEATLELTNYSSFASLYSDSELVISSLSNITINTDQSSDLVLSGRVKPQLLYNANGLFVMTNHTFTRAKITAGQDLQDTEDFMKSGYYPLGVVGYGMADPNCMVVRINISNPRNNYATVSYRLRAVGSDVAKSESAFITILWVRNRVS